MAENRFDWNPVLTHPVLCSQAARLVDAVESAGKDRATRGASYITRRAKRLQLAQQLISSLYVAYTSGDLISVPQSPRYYSAKTPTPGRVHASHLYAKELSEALKDLGWMRVVKEGKKDETFTLMQADGELESVFQEIGLIWMAQQPRPRHELISLKDVKRGKNGRPIRKGKKSETEKFELPVQETGDVVRMRENLEYINGRLSEHCFHLDLSDEHYMDLRAELALKARQERVEADEDGTSSDTEPVAADDMQFASLQLHNVQMRRVFARGSMQKGGRFYGGWWQGIPSLHRPHIRIDGHKTIEVDYSGVAIRIISAMVGRPLPADIDPYDIGLPGWLGSSDPRRKTVKKAVNALINDEDGVYSVNKTDQAVMGVDAEEFKRLLQKTHPLIFDRLADGIGLQAQYIDSQVAETVMLEMLKDDIVVLPIHDSFRVRAGYADWLSEVMKAAFRDVAGAAVSVEADFVKTDAHYGKSETQIRSELDNTEDEAERMGVTSTEALFNTLTDRNSMLMDSYLNSYELWKAQLS